jgi:hypothetical protein
MNNSGVDVRCCSLTFVVVQREAVYTSSLRAGSRRSLE